MSGIKGKKKEQIEITKKVGLAEVNVISINPNMKEWEDVLGFTLKEDQEEFSYTGISKDGNPFIRVDVWLKEARKEDGSPFKVTFFLEDKVRMNKEGSRGQYINNIGVCSWAEDEEHLPTWFAKREYWEAKNGEEDLYGLLRSWLSLDYRDEETELRLNWKKLMKGDVEMIKEQIGGDLATTFVAMATVVTKTKEDDDGEEQIVEYQGVWNRQFMPQYCMKHFRVKDYNDPLVQESILSKDSEEMKKMKLHEKFVYNVIGEYGCKDFYKLSEIQDYDPSENLAASDATMLGEGEDDSSDEY